MKSAPVTVQLDSDQEALLNLLGTAWSSAPIRTPHQGDDNRVAVVDERWVVRVARTPEGRKLLSNELAVLAELPGSLRIPRPAASTRAGMVYELIPGRHLDRETWRGLNEAGRHRVAGQLRDVLRALHSVPTGAPPEPLDYLDRDWVCGAATRSAQTPARMELSFDPHAIVNRFEHAWNLANWSDVLVHADLKPTNLIFDGENLGVIDFGGLALGDPAIDYGILAHHLGQDILVSMEIEQTPLAARACCYADLYALRRCTRGWTRSASRFH